MSLYFRCKSGPNRHLPFNH